MAEPYYPYLVRYSDYTLDTLLLSASDGKRLVDELKIHGAHADVHVLSVPPVFSLSQNHLFGRK